MTWEAIPASFGKTIAISYFKEATTPNKVITETKSWYCPNVEVENSVVRIGSVTIAKTLAMSELDDNFKTFLVKVFILVELNIIRALCH